MGQLGKLEMIFENDDKLVELKMKNIDPEIQFKIIELCMRGVHEETKLNDVKQDKEHKIFRSGLTEEQAKEGYQVFTKPLCEENEYINNKRDQNNAPRIHSFNPDKSIRKINGAKHYQLFYICPDCGNKGKHHIEPGTEDVVCHNTDCLRTMMVRPATPKGLPNHDEWGNYYIAGEFKMSMKDKEDEEEFLRERENQLLISNIN